MMSQVVCPSVRPSVFHVSILWQNDYRSAESGSLPGIASPIITVSSALNLEGVTISVGNGALNAWFVAGLCKRS